MTFGQKKTNLSDSKDNKIFKQVRKPGDYSKSVVIHPILEIRGY